MARQAKLSLQEVLERVLDSDEEYSNSDFTDSDYSEEEPDPCERQSQLFEAGTNPDESQYHEQELEPTIPTDVEQVSCHEFLCFMFIYWFLLLIAIEKLSQ